MARKRSQNLARRIGSTPAVGSSRKASTGSWTKVAASDRRRCMPPEAFDDASPLVVPELDPVEQLVDPPPASQRQPVHRGVEVEVLAQRELGKQGRRLRQVADHGALRGVQLRRRRAEHAHRRRCRVRLEQAGHESDGRGLAATARADQPEDRAPLQPQVERLDDLPSVEALGEPLGDDERPGTGDVARPRGGGSIWRGADDGCSLVAASLIGVVTSPPLTSAGGGAVPSTRGRQTVRAGRVGQMRRFVIPRADGYLGDVRWTNAARHGERR